jgi:3-(3-hydroxy-phenyl)propionate hydroxylase
MMPSGDLDAQVIVVGGGPTGLTTANLLGRYGVRTLLIERNTTTVQEPRAVSIDDESLRTMQAIGVIKEVLGSVVAGYGSEYLTPARKVFLKVEPSSMPYGFPRRNAFRQPLLEAQLRTNLQQFPSVETLFGWCVEAIGQHANGLNIDHVAVTLRGPGGALRVVNAAYVVAADGASSFIRNTLGILLEGQSFSEKWLIVDLETSPAPTRDTLVFCDVRRPCIALPGPAHTRRFEFKLLPADDPERMVDPQVIGSLLDAHGAAPHSRVVRRTVYTFHARLSPRWSVGRIHFAGDACHLTPPFAGQGMNSGIRDAHNLAWKLAWTLNGTFPADILRTYQQERSGHVGEMIKLALRMGRIMGPSSPLAGWLTQTTFRLLDVWRPLRDYFGQMKYKPKPRFAKGLLIPDGRPRWRTAVGRLIPQPRVTTLEGEMPLDDVVGDGFAVIGFTDPDTFAAATQDDVFALLRARRILISAEPMTPLHNDPAVVADHTGELLRSLDAAAERIFLVRPDRYVMGAFSSATASRFVRRLRMLLADDGARAAQPPPLKISDGRSASLQEADARTDAGG